VHAGFQTESREIPCVLSRGWTIPPWQRLIRAPHGWNTSDVLSGQCECEANCATRLPFYVANDSMRRKYRFGLVTFLLYIL